MFVNEPLFYNSLFKRIRMERSFIDHFIQNGVHCVSDPMIDNTRCLSAAARATKVGIRSNHEVSLLLCEVLQVYRRVKVHWERSPHTGDGSTVRESNPLFPNF